ncbi:hypothetical protein CEJ39_00800 [Rhodococcus pyridinivorans]|nr:hypothetical protein CEJ39_00800 [Rhodococcus pyridinivorans]
MRGWRLLGRCRWQNRRRMEHEGLVEGEQVRWGPNSTKTRYSITGEGIRAFREWMSTPLDYAPVRDAAHTVSRSDVCDRITACCPSAARSNGRAPA